MLHEQGSISVVANLERQMTADVVMQSLETIFIDFPEISSAARAMVARECNERRCARSTNPRVTLGMLKLRDRTWVPLVDFRDLWPDMGLAKGLDRVAAQTRQCPTPEELPYAG